MDSGDELDLPPFPSGQYPRPDAQTAAIPTSEFTIFTSSQLTQPGGDVSHGSSHSEGEGVDDEAGVGDGDGDGDIVHETLTLWRQLRNIAAGRQRRSSSAEAPVYNMDTFVKELAIRYPRRLASILLEPTVRASLGSRGLTITMEDEPAPVHSSIIRNELRALIKEPIFANFEP
ncbi:hypothetical protein F4861DRAFT_542374, partial [Xylaria intraflava]